MADTKPTKVLFYLKIERLCNFTGKEKHHVNVALAFVKLSNVHFSSRCPNIIKNTTKFCLKKVANSWFSPETPSKCQEMHFHV